MLSAYCRAEFLKRRKKTTDDLIGLEITSPNPPSDLREGARGRRQVTEFLLYHCSTLNGTEPGSNVTHQRQLEAVIGGGMMLKPLWPPIVNGTGLSLDRKSTSREVPPRLK
jgi:hypothetical protein